MDKVAGKVVWLLGGTVFPAVWLTVDGLVPVGWAGGGVVGGSEAEAALGPIVASVTGAAVWELLGVAWVVIMVWIVGLVARVLFAVAKVARVLFAVVGGCAVVCVAEVSESDVVAAV